MAQNIFQFSGPSRFVWGRPAHRTVAGVTISSDAQHAAAVAAPKPDEERGFREKVLRFDENYAGRNALGYKEDFLAGWNVPAPTTNDDHEGALLKKGTKAWVIPYYHYSLVMNVDRRLLAWAACNVDYSTAARKFTKSRKCMAAKMAPRSTGGGPGGGHPTSRTPLLRARKKDRSRSQSSGGRPGRWGTTADRGGVGNSDTYHGPPARLKARVQPERPARHLGTVRGAYQKK